MSQNPPRQNRFTNPWIGVIILVIFMVISLFQNTNLFARPAQSAADPTALTVCMLDVGQADCFLLMQGEACMLIDCGNPGDSDRILRELAGRGADSLDYLVLTHPHSDHTGSAEELLSSLPIGTVIVSAPAWEKGLYDTLSDAIAASDAAVNCALAGDSFTLGNASFQILSPAADTDISDLNDASICLRIGYAGRYALFTGDAGTSVEETLLASGVDLRADLLKASHHGSDSANSAAFLEAVHPTCILLSCCEDSESDDLPDPDALARLEATGAAICRSDRNGVVTVTIRSDGEMSALAERKA